jgi:uncharacterized membrane protein
MSEENKNVQAYFRQKAWIVETTYFVIVSIVLTLVSLALVKAIDQIVFQDSVGIILGGGVTVYLGIYFYDIYRTRKLDSKKR